MIDRSTRQTIKVAAKAKVLDRDLAGAPAYDKTKVSHIADMLASTTIGLQSAKKVLEEITSISSSDISPDGMLGGRGYVMSIQDIKVELSEVVHKMSALRDTLSDELSNPGWGLSDDEKESLASIDDKVDDHIEETQEDISKEIEMIFGTDEETEGSPSDEDTEEPGTDEGEDDFPSYEEDSEEKKETPKNASSSNTKFVGLNNRADGVTKKLASAVLKGLVKSCANGAGN